MFDIGGILLGLFFVLLIFFWLIGIPIILLLRMRRLRQRVEWLERLDNFRREAW